MRAVFPSNLSHSQISKLHRDTREALVEVERKNGGEFRSSFEILFDDRPAFHNGLATVIPRNFIWVHTVAPINESSIGYSPEYMRATLVHEMGHMYYLQKRRGIFAPGAWVFGNLSSPLGAWPRWMHEGWATWTEGRFEPDDNLAYLNFLKRSYADYTKRHPDYRLNSSMLEGSSPLLSTEAGEIPYAFGYSMLDKIFSKMPPDAWGESSADSLGISFRKTALKQGFSMDEIFSQTEKEWRNARLSDEASESSALESAQSLGALNKGMAIARGGDDTEIWNLAKPKPVRYKWREHHWHLVHAAQTITPGQVLAAYYRAPATGQSGTRLSIGLFSTPATSGKNLKFLCEVYSSDEFSILGFKKHSQTVTAKLTPRTPEENPSAGHLFEIEIPERCDARASQARTSTSLFFRDFNTQLWVLREDQSSWTLRGLISPKEQARSECAQVFAPTSEKDIRLCLSAVLNREESRLPAMIMLDGRSRWFVKTQPSPTGAQSAEVFDNDFYWIEKRWEEDRLHKVSLKLLAQENSVPWNGAVAAKSSQIAALPLEDAPNIEPYRARSTLWPHYWMPRFYATAGGAIVSGTVWYHDLTKIYDGSLDLGYDTVSRAPYVATSLQRKLGGLKWPHHVDFSFSYLSDTTFGYRIDQSNLQSGVSGAVPLGSSLILVPRLSAKARWTSITGESRYFLIPTASLSLQYRHSTRPSALNVDHSKHQPGAFLLMRGAWVNRMDFYSEAAVSDKWPISWTLHFEYGKTSKRNLPFSYFEWGGAYPLYLSQPSFVSRGFAPRFAATAHLARAAITSGFKWSDRIGGLGWSRFEIEKISQDIFAETVTYDSLRRPDIRIGQDFFSTVGTELNFWLRSLFYLKSRAFVGIYQGYGLGAETRFAVGLSSNLDI